MAEPRGVQSVPLSGAPSALPSPDASVLGAASCVTSADVPLSSTDVSGAWYASNVASLWKSPYKACGEGGDDEQAPAAIATAVAAAIAVARTPGGGTGNDRATNAAPQKGHTTAPSFTCLRHALQGRKDIGLA